MKWQSFIYISFLLLYPVSLTAQTNDSLKIYRNIKERSDKYRITRWLYDYIFVDPTGSVDPTPQITTKKRINPFLQHNGKTIRKINIVVLDPFGYSADDTTIKPNNYILRVGNRIHASTRNKIVKNYLLFKENAEVDALSIAESERILRGVPYVEDARIFMKRVHPDSVDVTVIVHDQWSITAASNINVYNLEFNFTNPDFRLNSRNFAGYGHQLEQRLAYNSWTDQLELSGNHHVLNIGKTFISSLLSYKSSPDINQASIALNRPFYSPLTKWAGGIWLNTTRSAFYLPDLTRHHLSYTNYDFWVAKSLKPIPGKTLFSKSSAFIIAARYFPTRYNEQPSISTSGKLYLNTTLYLGSIGLTVRQYYKERYIYRFGANEDVPEGLTLQLLYGVLYTELNPFKYYTGFRVSKGRLVNRIGYMSGNISYGTFFNSFQPNDATLRVGFFYFSNLLKGREWHFRQFINYKLIYGINKFSAQTIGISSNEMYGFSSGTFVGTKKMILNFQTVAYSPVEFIGFRFAPVVSVGFGMLSSSPQKLLRNRVYQAYSLGVLVRNENLLISTFEITLGFYPFLPDGNINRFSYNPITSFNLGIEDFGIQKPAIIGYD